MKRLLVRFLCAGKAKKTEDRQMASVTVHKRGQRERPLMTLSRPSRRSFHQLAARLEWRLHHAKLKSKGLLNLVRKESPSVCSSAIFRIPTSTHLSRVLSRSRASWTLLTKRRGAPLMVPSLSTAPRHHRVPFAEVGFHVEPDAAL